MLKLKIHVFVYLNNSNFIFIHITHSHFTHFFHFMLTYAFISSASEPFCWFCWKICLNRQSSVLVLGPETHGLWSHLSVCLLCPPGNAANNEVPNRCGMTKAPS